MLAFLLDHIFADYYIPAMTANLNVSYQRLIPPAPPLVIQAWPVNEYRRKKHMKDTTNVKDEAKGGLSLMVQAEGFIIWKY